MKSSESTPGAFRQVGDAELRAVAGGVKAQYIPEEGVTIDCLGYIGPDGKWRPHASRPPFGVEIDVPVVVGP